MGPNSDSPRRRGEQFVALPDHHHDGRDRRHRRKRWASRSTLTNRSTTYQQSRVLSAAAVDDIAAAINNNSLCHAISIPWVLGTFAPAETEAPNSPLNRKTDPLHCRWRRAVHASLANQPPLPSSSRKLPPVWAWPSHRKSKEAPVKVPTTSAAPGADNTYPAALRVTRPPVLLSFEPADWKHLLFHWD